ncbi:MAG TPA: GDP-mannose 4,6-dehydratase, partial [Planctomycetota bacterium]|nr:GDP-mannose 4,6-dehydratase [Planctomycetota bacterium]
GGHRVVVIDDLSTGRKENICHLLSNTNFKFVVGSILDETLMAPLVDECEMIYHLAAAVGVFLVVHSPVRAIETTAGGTQTVLKLAWLAKKKVLLASSSEVYGKRSEVPFREDDDLVLGPPDKGRWSYACSKLLDEFLALAYHRERGLRCVIARFFNIVGPRQVGRYGMVIPRFVQQARDGGPIVVYGDGRQTRSFTHVADAVGCIIGLANTQAAEGSVVNIGSDREISIRELAEIVRAIANPAAEIQHIPYDQAYAAGFEDLPRRVPDISRARRLAGYTPTRSIEDIIRELTQR